jgi:putative transposase
MLQGNGGQDIFFSDDDREHLYLLIQEGVGRFGHRIHAFCLMDNHDHLAVQVAEVSLSKVVQNLSFRYTRRVNKAQARVVHLFQGRYNALLVDADAYFLELCATFTSTRCARGW